jgi:excisionase family DNA binding protein
MNTPSTPPERPVRLDDVAAFLGVSEKTVSRLIKAGDLRAFKIRGQWFSQMSFVHVYIEAQIQRAQGKGYVSC